MKNLIFLPVLIGGYMCFTYNNKSCDCTLPNVVQATWVGETIFTDLDTTIQPKDSIKVQKRNYTVFKSSRILSTKELKEAKRKRALEQKNKTKQRDYFGIK